MKRLVKLALLLMVLLLPATAHAYDIEVDGIYYNINGNEAVVTYLGKSLPPDNNVYTGNVTIPSTITYNDMTYSVTSIGDWAFSGCSELTNIAIPNSVTSIGSLAFYHCSGLTSVDIVDLESWCNISFSNAYSNPCCYAHRLLLNGEVIKDLVIPNSVNSIGQYAFSNCSGITSIDIPNSVTSIGNYAFIYCSGLTSVTIPNSVTSIGDGVFSGCSGLTSATIGNSVTTIGGSAFSGCGGLTNIDIPNSVISIDSYAFYCCSGLTSIAIPNSVTSIGYRSFACCDGLTSITIPNSVTSIDNRAFGWCFALQDVYSFITNPYSVQTYGGIFDLSPEQRQFSANDSTELTRTLHVPIGTTAAYQDTEFGWYFDTIVEMAPGETNFFSMADTTVWHGDVIAIPVRLDNNLDVMAFQTDVFLPEGFTIVTDEDDEYLVTPSDRLTSDHTIMTQDVSNGAVRVICFTPNSQPISGNEGDLFYINVQVPDGAEGDYTIGLRNSLLTTTDYQELVVPDTTATITVKQFIPGDVNDSRTVNVTDIVVTAQYILEMNPNPFIFVAADMNVDGSITVTDAMLIAYLINHPTMNAPKRMPALMDCSDRMSAEGVILMPGETRTVSIALDNETDYTAFQLDLRLPEGLTASNFQLTDRAGSHAFDVNTLDSGKLRVLCYSPALTAIGGHEGALLTFDVTATGDVKGDITVDGIELVTTSCQSVLLDGFAIGVNATTGVNEVAGDKVVDHIEYFNLAGQRIDRPASGVTLVVTTFTDGTRTTTKVIR